MKKISRNSVLGLVFSFLVFAAISFAQEKFDVVSFTVPKGWEREASQNAIQIGAGNKTKGTFCLITQFKSVSAGGNSKTNFDTAWESLVNQSLNISVEPQMQPVANNNGWEVQSGLAAFESKDVKGVALLVTASGGGKMVNTMMVTNTDEFQADAESFFSSLDLPPIAAKESQTAVKTQASTPPNFVGSSRDYEFTVPAGWTRQDSNNEIVLRYKNSPDKYVLSFQPLIAASGNLENDSERIFWEVFEGWKLEKKATLGAFEKGRTRQGFAYFWIKKHIVKGEGYGSNRDGLLLLVQIGNKVAVISGSQPFNDIAGHSVSAVNLILYDLGFKNAGANANFKKDLLGTWLTADTASGSFTTYSANNTFSTAGAMVGLKSRDAYTDTVTTKGFGSDGSYTLNGNLLTTKKSYVYKSLIRFYFTKYDDQTPWESKMGTLFIDDHSYGTIVVYKREKE